MRLRWFFIISIVGATLTSLAVIGIESLPGFYFHPLATGNGSACSATNHSGCGYAFWSGIAGSFVTGFLTSLPQWMLISGLFLWHHNCHVKGCWRFGHIDPKVGRHACPPHHSLGHLHGVSQGVEK